MNFTQIPADAFDRLAVNAGVLLTQFDPESAVVSREDILGATTGGVTVRCVPEYTDFGEDMDNCPKNMLQLRRLSGWECTLAGTLLTVDTAAAALLLGAADTDADTQTVTPRARVAETDFHDLWYVCDYGTGGGFIAVRLKNALSTGGLSLQTADAGKGKLAFTFTGHSTMDDPDAVPMEFFLKK